jgi:hypothetical protein
MAMGVEEAAFPDSSDNLETHQKKTLIKQAAVWFRIDSLLDRSLTAAKRLAALIARMESRSARGPPDYEMGPMPTAPYVVYGGHIGPTKEPSWQNKVLSIVGSLLVAGILAIFAVLWAMNENIRDLRGDNRLVVQKQEAMEKHIEATDRDVAEIKREIWPHKH